MSYRLTQFTFIMALIVVTLGALTRLLDAGLGCPDWPGCYGQIIPPSKEELSIVDEGKAWMEMIHRYVATALGFIILVIALVIQGANDASNKARWISRLLLVLVIVQGTFGMWTVTLKLLPQIVTIHLLGGMTVLATSFWLALTLRQDKYKKINVQEEIETKNKPKIFASLALVLVVCQIALGGWTSSTYSGLACTDFPTCDGHTLPPLVIDQAFDLTEFSDRNYEGGLMSSEARVTVQYVHRVMALIVFITILTLFFKLRQVEAYKAKANVLLGLTLLQITIGVSTAVLMLPLSLALIHNTGAALLLLAIVYINYSLYSRRGIINSPLSS